MTDDKTILEIRAGIVERLIKAFQIERYVYLSASALSVIMLLIVGGWMMTQAMKPDSNVKLADTVMPLFGPTGVVVVCTHQLLRMWNRAMDLLLGPVKSSGGDA